MCLDSSRRFLLFGERFFRHANHAPFLEAAFPPFVEAAGGPRWRIVFSHHPPYCAGPMYGNSRSSLEHLVPLYRRSGERLVLSGHEHNFQHSRADGIDYFITGGGGKVRSGRPSGFEQAATVGWAAAVHFLLVQGERRPRDRRSGRRGRRPARRDRAWRWCGARDDGDRSGEQYVTESLLVRAGRSRSPWLLLGSLFRWATVSIASLFTFLRFRRRPLVPAR